MVWPRANDFLTKAMEAGPTHSKAISIAFMDANMLAQDPPASPSQALLDGDNRRRIWCGISLPKKLNDSRIGHQNSKNIGQQIRDDHRTKKPEDPHRWHVFDNRNRRSSKIDGLLRRAKVLEPKQQRTYK